jgi:hypothetical protein
MLTLAARLTRKLNAEPVKIFDQGVFIVFATALNINVLDAEQKLTTQLTRHAFILQS